MSKELKQAKDEFQVMYDNISKDLSGILQRIWEDKVKAASKSMAELQVSLKFDHIKQSRDVTVCFTLWKEFQELPIALKDYPNPKGSDTLLALIDSLREVGITN